MSGRLDTAVAAGTEAAEGYAYHLLRAALDTFQRNLAQLDAGELAQVRRKADKSYELESLVLASDEARDVFVAPGDVERAFAAVAERYASVSDLADDLQRNGMDEAALRQALRRELLFDSVMQRVGARCVAVSDIDVRLFYEMHRERFELPEKRTARHILITVNPDYPENTPAAAAARIARIAARLQGKPNRFSSLARRHSECPTALEGGKLGVVARGQLFPAVDAALFALPAGGVSEVVETEVGLHLVMCERIEPARRLPLAKARPGIERLLEQRKRRNCQKAWLGELRRAAGTCEVS